MDIQFKQNSVVHRRGNGDLECVMGESCLTLKDISSGMSHAFLQLITWCNEENLGKEISQKEGELSLSSFYYYLDLFKKKGFIAYKTPFFELIPLQPIASLEKELLAPFQLCRFAIWRKEEEEIIIETPLAPAKVVIQGREGILFFYALRKSTSSQKLYEEFPQFDKANIIESLSLLASVNLLSFEKESPSLAKWESHDLYFHSRSRLGRHNNPFGGTYHLKGVIPPEPCSKLCQTKLLLPLEKPREIPDLSLIGTIGKRKSIREHGNSPLTVSQLSSFLFHSARIINRDFRREEEYSSRPYPGGGARYELDLYLIIHNCTGLSRGVYHYHPFEHALCQVSDLNEAAVELLKDSSCACGKKEYPQVLIILSARFLRMFWKYQSMGYATILKDVGVLMQTMYLTATALDLAPCALGGGDSDLFCKVMGTDYLDETSVGEFILGSKKLN